MPAKLYIAIPRLLSNDVQAAADWYVHNLGFTAAFFYPPTGTPEYAGLRRDNIELHLTHAIVDPKKNDTMVYIRVEGIEELYEQARVNGVVHPNGHLERKSWRQLEFAVLDPNGNLLTYGQQL